MPIAKQVRKSKIASSEFDFFDIVGNAEADGKKRTKGEKSKLKLLQAAVDIFREVAFHAARVSDICAKAGMAQGSFYLYFRDKDSLASELIEILLEQLTNHVLHVPHFDDPFDAIKESNRRYAAFFRGSGQINRAISQITDALPETRVATDRVNVQIAQRVADGIARRMPETKTFERQRLALAYGMVAMIDGLYFGYFGSNESSIQGLFKSDDELIEFASVLWYRAQFGRNPADQHFESAAAFKHFMLPLPNSKIHRKTAK